jgi:hypothetical protein
VDTVSFVDGEPDALVFPGWSVVYCAESDAVKYPDDSIGTLRRTPFGATLKKAPKGLFTGHFCGTLQQHAEGAIYDSSAPPISVGALGWPRCCNPPPLVVGPAGVGGVSPFSVVTSPVGADCCSAPVLTVGATFSFVHPMGTTLDVWCRYTLPAGNWRFSIVTTPTFPFNFSALGLSGLDCLTAGTFEFSTATTSDNDFTLASDSTLCVQFLDTSTEAVAFTWVVTALP